MLLSEQSTSSRTSYSNPYIHCYMDGIQGDSERLFSPDIVTHLLKKHAPDEYIRKTLTYVDGPKELHGVTGFILSPGNHVTLHTYPDPSKRIVFCDSFGPSINHTELYRDIRRDFQIASQSPYGVHDRGKTSMIESTFPGTCNTEHYGPHLTMQISLNTAYIIDSNYIEHCLLHIVEQIEMHRILGPFTIEDEGYLSGIVIIAESHISIHIDRRYNTAYIDIFSCKNFSIHTALRELGGLFPGTIHDEYLLHRGEHFYKE